jgi:hypothetical protein
VNTAAFPAVPAKRCGVRLTLTAHHTEADVAGVVAALAEHLPAALADEGSSVEDLRRAFTRELRGRPEVLPVAPRTPPSPLRLEHVRSVLDVKSAEWNARLGDRGAFDVAALRTLESVFAAVDDEPGAIGPGDIGRGDIERGDIEPGDELWDFHYLTVRDDDGAPVAMTFFTTARWKDDMLSPAAVSREVERRRAEAGDPLFLTSPMVGMGSLLTEGDHLWLDRSRDWRTALRLILQAARVEEDRVGAAAVVLRDLPEGDEELHDFLIGEGLLRIPVFDSWVREIDFATDEEFLAGLPRRHRYHQRTRVLPWEQRYRVEVVAGGSPEADALPAPSRDHLYALYRAVHARALELNVFPLPRRLLDAVLGLPGWEIVLLHLAERPEAPVAFGVQHVGASHVTPVFAGLDYAFVPTHHSYQQLLFQALRSARRHGARRVLYGMGAGLHKARFGARRERRWAYLQPTETYNADVLAHLAESASST